MKYKKLGKSDLEVSVVGLGCMMFGSMCDQQQTNDVVDVTIDEGINMFDVADIYGHPPGTAETMVGKALGNRRKDIVLATKFGAQSGGHGGSVEGGGTREYIMNAVERSLERLGTDYIDLYQYHFPEVATPIEETLQALDVLVKQGKVRYIGCSNMDGTQLSEADSVASENNLSEFVSAQNWYSLLHRDIETDLLPVAEKISVGIIPYFPLESGLLTGKYRKGAEDPEGSRLAKWGGAFKTDDKMDTVEAMREYGESIDRSVLELAMGRLTNRPAVATVIAGVTTPEQVRQNAAAGTWELTADDMATLDQLTAVWV
ncbi:MAG: aldo/keto reductase [Pseudomonadota bacterium]|nr:aldo/keto reductase [Pseudomonadota bacterium]